MQAGPVFLFGATIISFILTIMVDVGIDTIISWIFASVLGIFLLFIIIIRIKLIYNKFKYKRV